MAISSRLAELSRKYGASGGGQAEKQSTARKAGTVSARLAALQQRTAQNGSVSAKSQSADAQYLRGDRKPPAPTADAAKTLLSAGANPLAAPQGKAAYTPPTTAQKKAAREDAAAQKSVVLLPTAAEKQAEKKASAPEIARNAVFSGLSQFNKGLASTLDFFMPTDFLGEYDPFSRLNDYYAKENEYFRQRMADSVSDRSRAAQVAAEVGAGTVAALPNAVLALMSAGTSLAAQGTTQGLQAASAAANSGIAGAVGNAVSEMIKNPLYWSSYLQTAGTDYEKAKANGASDLEATATALISSALNAGIEISGGLEVLPDQVKSGGVRAVGNWVKSMLDEGKEEVLQSIVTGITQKGIYDRSKEAFSLTNEDAIVNPKRALNEFAMGAAVGGVLGGAQTGVVSGLNAVADAHNSRLRQPVGTLPMVERTMQNLPGAPFDRAQAAQTQTVNTNPIQTMNAAPAGAVEAAGQNKTASTVETGAYRAAKPENVEMPTVPIINLSMQTVADMNGGVLPKTGNALRKDAISRARVRLGLDQNGAAYIPASNVVRNGEEYVLKITRSSLDKMLSPSNGGIVSPESIAVIDNIERIANNGVYFKSEGDRKGRQQIAGYDHLMTTVYIDDQPYSVDMRVRVYDAPSGGENRLYYFTPEEIVTTKKVGANIPTGTLHERTMIQDETPTVAPIIADSSAKGNTQYAQNSVGQTGAIPAAERVQANGFDTPSTLSDTELRSAFGENGAAAYRLGWRGDVDETDYYMAFSHAYNAGAAGRSLDSVQERVLTDAQRDTAFEAGRSDADAEARRAGFTTVYGADSGLVWDEHTRAMDQKAAGQVNEVARRLGVKVLFADRVAGAAANAQIENGVITIAKDAQNPVRAVFGHEITHRIQELAPEEYRAFREAAMADTEFLDQQVEGTRALYAKGGQELTSLAAMDELAADYAGRLMEDGALLERFIQANQGRRTLLEKLRDVFRSLADRLTGQYKSQARQAGRRLEQALKAAERQAEALQGQKNTAQEGGVRYSLNPEFSSRLDEWDGKSDRTFDVGTTSEALKGIGVMDRKIIWHSRKVSTILRTHEGMTMDIIKQVPNVLENPIIVLKSQNSDSRIAVFGEVTDSNGAPVTAILELQPTNKGGQLLDMNIIASAYGKDTNPAGFVQKSDLLYLDPDKNRTKSWLQGLGLQLPSDTTALGSIGTISYQDGKVKIEGVPYSQYMQSGGKGNTKFSMKTDSMGQALTEAQEEFFKDSADPDIRRSLKGSDQLAREIDRLMKQVQDGTRSEAEVRQEIRGLVDEVYQGMVEQYGSIKPGEKPAREARVPQKTADDRKVSRTVRTVLEAGATPDAAVQNIEELTATGVFSYETYTDKAALADAENTIRDKGYATALAEWSESVGKGEVSKANTATGWALYNAAANAGDIKSAMTVLTKMVGHQRNAAQAVQATRILKSMSPEGQLYAVQRSVQNLQEELNERYGGKGRPELKVDPELAQRLLQAGDQKARDEALKDIYRDIGRQMPSRFVDKWNAWRYMAMLGNPRTHVRNIVGNAGFAPVVAVKDLTATAIEAAVGRVSGGTLNRTKGAVGLSRADRALVSAAWGDYVNAQDAALGGGKYSDFSNANQYIEQGRRIFRGKALETYRKANSKALDAEDVWFSRPHYAWAMAQYCKANHITAEQVASGKGMDSARAYAIQEAQKATYRDTNALSQTISDLGRYRGKNPVKKGVSTIMEGVLPFRKTPANILARGLEYSPAGLLKGMTWDLYQVKQGNLSGADAIDRISAGLTGTGLLALGVYCAAQSLVRGAGGDDKDKKSFEELLGHQTYALELPDGTSVTLDWLAPEVLPFFVGVNLWEQTQGKKEPVTLSALLKAAGNVTEPLLEMSCLQSLNDVFDAVGYASSGDLNGLTAALVTSATSYLTQGVPTILGQFERTGQDVRMTTYTEKNAFLTQDAQYAIGRISGRLPGLDYNQIPYIDAWGRTESTGGAGKRAADNFLNPAYTDEVGSSPMEDELMRLYKATGKAGLFPDRAGKYFTVDGVRKDLTAEEYVTYATEKGRLSYTLLTELTASKPYERMTDEQKVKAISEAYDLADKTAKASVAPGYTLDSWMKKAEEAEKKYRIPRETYVSLYSRTSGIESLRYKDKDEDKNGTPDAIPNSRSLLVMMEVYKTPGLNDKQRRAMFEYLGVGKDFWHWNKTLVQERLREMQKVAE